MRTTLSILGAVCAVLVASAPPPAAHAQQAIGSFIITPYAGVYAPASKVATLKEGFGSVGGSFSERHDPALALGANASYWINERMAIEFGGAYAFSNLKARGAVSGVGGSFSASRTRDSYVLLGSTKLMMNVLPAESPYNLRFGVGPAIIHRGGDAYKNDDYELTGLTDLGAALSLCSRFAIGPNLGLRLRVEDYIYDARLRYKDPSLPAANFDFDSRLQNDFVISAGLQFAFR